MKIKILTFRLSAYSFNHPVQEVASEAQEKLSAFEERVNSYCRQGLDKIDWLQSSNEGGTTITAVITTTN